MQLTILGSSAGGPFQGRNYTAQILKIENETYLIDCGEGTQHQLYHHRVRYDGINQIFISHLHGDHVFGLMGIITSFCLKKRTDTLTIYGPEGLRELIETMSRVSRVYYPYPLEIHELDTTVHQLVFETRCTEVWSIPLHHRVPCMGWHFREKTRPANINSKMIEAYNIHFTDIKKIKAGGDYTLPDGSVIPNSELTIPPKTPASYAFCSDTTPFEPVIEIIQGVTCLYHEATFTNEHTEEAAYSHHSTAEQAAQIALSAGVQQLLIGHFSARYKDVEQHLTEARAVFEATDAVEEGRVYEISRNMD